MQFREEAAVFRGATQNIRTMSEEWAGSFLYCLDCRNERVSTLPNNEPVADFICDRCGATYELKSQKTRFRNKVVDGAYKTMIDRLSSDANPTLLLLRYSAENWQVLDMLAVPKFFFTSLCIEKRRPLAPTARRAGWVGCNILLNAIPAVGKIPIIRDQLVRDRHEVWDAWDKSKALHEDRLESRSWLLLTQTFVEQLPSQFSLAQLYEFEGAAHTAFPENNNIRPKLRQQLQKLRDRGFIQFLGNGRYQRLDG